MLVLMLMSGGRQQTSEMASASANRIRREARLRVPRAVVRWRWLFLADSHHVCVWHLQVLRVISQLFYAKKNQAVAFSSVLY